ncbi:DMT family transporter [Halospeciosus flavus]|uniref:DMT family transporter n=1 Tax=Halospeciosus flavus TaxID=3032283 RepID=A0ABD5Z9L8_9EURY|nr:EamA family transporter [Halospeciosus flavus]
MSTYRNFGLFVVLAAVWGSAFMAIKAGLAYFPPVFFAAVRYDLAAVVMLAYVLYSTDHWKPEGRDEWLLVGVGSVFLIAGYHAFLFVGEQFTTSAAAAVVVSLSPVLTSGFSRVLLPSDRLSPLGILGMLLGLAGVVVLANPDPANLLGGNTVGELLVFGAVLCFAFGSVLTQRLDTDLPHETMEGWSMIGGALLMHVVSLGLGEPQTAELTVPAVAALVYLSVLSSAAGFLIYFTLLERLGPIEINMVSYVAPMFAALSGWLFLGEVIDARTAVGFFVIFVGFCLLKRRALADEVEKFRAAVATND